MINESILSGYENTKLIRYDELEDNGIKTVKFSELKNLKNEGVLKACFHNTHGELVQQYTELGNHVGVVAATRLGKTTSYVVPTIISFAMQAVKKSFIVSDPKAEIYRQTAATLREQGYKIKVLNFRDYLHTDYWNPLTPIFRKYRRAMDIYEEVELVEVNGSPRNRFMGKVYESQAALDYDIECEKEARLDSVGNDIDNLAEMMIITESTKDPTWEDGARDLLRAFFYAMLEDSDAKENPITEQTYSMDTLFRILASFSEENSTYDNGYFSDRNVQSKAYALAKDVILLEARTTRSGYVSVFSTKVSGFKEVVTRRITSCNSFDLSELGEEPTALFLCYRDELKAHFKTISIFVQDAYRCLIEQAGKKKNGKLDVPFYFILDEFGNFAQLRDFETTISACAGRNIWFILIVQSYAQLNAVYGEAVSEIIRDNLNVHVFFGSNNPETLSCFSDECGLYTRISPRSAIGGVSAEIDRYEIETIPLISKSRLSHFDAGECVITEANSGYVLLSKMERYFMCDEFNHLPESDLNEYFCTMNPLEKKYKYIVKPKERRRYPWDH